MNATTSSNGKTLFAEFDFAKAIDGYIDFQSTLPFKVNFTSFTSTGTGVSGFQVYSGFSGGSFDEDDARYTGFTTCSYGPCVLVNGDGTSGAFAPPKEFAVPGADQYSFRFNEDGNGPSNGNAQFEISAIPLPAGAWLLLSGIGSMALLHRRRKAA